MNVRSPVPISVGVDPRRSALVRRPLRGAIAIATTWLAVAGLALVLPSVACGPTQALTPREPTRCTFQNVDLTIVASKSINPTTTGEPRPVVVRVYQLKNDVRIRNVDFEEVWLRDKAALGDDLVQVGEVPIYPFSRTEVRFQRDEILMGGPQMTVGGRLVGLSTRLTDLYYRLFVDRAAAVEVMRDLGA